MSVKKKLDLPVGQKIRGYGMVNEYGEFEFTPEQTGSRQGKYKIVKEAANYSIGTTDKLILVRIKQNRANGLQLLTDFMKEVNKILADFRQYEF